MKRLAALLCTCAIVAFTGPSATLATVPPNEPTSPLIPIPAGCQEPAPAAVIFEGTLLARDARTGRFRVKQVRAGSDADYSVSGLVDIRLGPDVRFLTENESYIIGASPLGPNLPLSSTVREAKPTFGGNAVIELDETSLACPTLEDPLQVLHMDGTPIDTCVTTGLHGAKGSIALAILLPSMAAFGILLGLALIRWFFTGLFRVGATAASGERMRPRRDRAHGLVEE